MLHVRHGSFRDELFARCDAVMLFKPTAEDFPLFREGQVLWGAVHTVQNEDIVEEALKKKMTFIAMEDMYTYKPNGQRDVWLFHTQSELAGYCSVMHSLQLLGTKGWYDQPSKAAVISFGTAGRGAVHALHALDYTDVTVFTMRPPGSVLASIPGVKYGQYVRNPDEGSHRVSVSTPTSLTAMTRIFRRTAPSVRSFSPTRKESIATDTVATSSSGVRSS